MCVLLLVIFLLLFFSTRVCCLFFVWNYACQAWYFVLLFFFSFRFVSSFEQSNGNCMIFCLLFYCLKSGKCIIISVCLFFSKSRSFPSSTRHFANLPFLSSIFLCRTKLDTQKWIFFYFFKVQIRLDSFFKNSEFSREKVVFVCFGCNSSSGR